MTAVCGYCSLLDAVRTAAHRWPADLSGQVGELRPSTGERGFDPDTARLLQRYANLFNRHDWDGVRGLASADARLRVADCFDGLLRSSPSLVEYARNPETWTVEFGAIDGEPVLLVLLMANAIRLTEDRWSG